MAFFSKVAGATKHNEDGMSRQEIIKGLGRGDLLELEREPDNPEDPCAIAVVSDAGRIGYLPRQTAAELAPIMDSGARPCAYVTEITGGDEKRESLGVNIVVDDGGRVHADAELVRLRLERLEGTLDQLFRGEAVWPALNTNKITLSINAAAAVTLQPATGQTGDGLMVANARGSLAAIAPTSTGAGKISLFSPQGDERTILQAARDGGLALAVMYPNGQQAALIGIADGRPVMVFRDRAGNPCEPQGGAP